MNNKDFLLSLTGSVLLALGSGGGLEAGEVPEGVWVREGYRLQVALDTLQAPRFLEVGTGNVTYVSVPKEGKIYACKDGNGDGEFESQTVFVEGKDPKQIVQAMQWHEGWLWFAGLNSISKARDTDGDGVADEEVLVLGEDKLPTAPQSGHMWRALLIHKGRIYTHVGDQTNATDEPIDASERKKLISFAMDGSDKKVFASGIRNTERFVVRPGTDEIWGVDHDIDMLGWEMEGDRKDGQPITDHNPPAEMNHYQEGHFYGHPWIVGKNMPNLMFINHPKLLDYARMNTIPEWLMPSHCSANSMLFYKGDGIPGAHGDAFVAQKGGWNATEKVGYCLSRVYFENGHPWGERKVVSFLKDGTEVLGRPTDCIQAADGSILFSDDTGNKIYRLTYVGDR